MPPDPGDDTGEADGADPHLTVVVADDRPVVRRGLVAVADAADMDVVGRVALAFVAPSIERTRPHLLVVGYTDPPGAALAAVTAAREEDPEVAVLVVAEAASMLDLRAVVLAGADSVLLSRATEQELREAMTATAQGARRISPELAMRLAGPWREQTDPSPTALTPRELEVLQLLAEGLTNHEIGDRLRISPRTVKTHVQNIVGKLEVPHRTGAVAQGLRRGLIR